MRPASRNQALGDATASLPKLSSIDIGTLDCLPCGVLITDGEGLVHLCNAHMAKFLGWEKSELISKYVWDFSPPETRVFMQTHIWPTFLREKTANEVHVKLLKKCGESVPVLFNVELITIGDVAYYNWAFFRVNRRNDLEIALLDSKRLADQRAQELEQAGVELARSNEALSNFAYMASHDLKAPLNNVAFLAECIQEDMEGEPNPEVADHFLLLAKQISRMKTLTSDLLEYAQVGSNHGDFKVLDVTTFVTNIFDTVKPVSGFHLNISVNTKSEFTTLNVPLELVLRNLISNAIKHHDKETGVIEVSLTENDTDYTISVVDDGPGIPPELHEKAFEMFQKVHTRREVSGSGMGLSLIKRTVEQYGGMVSVQMVQPCGSQFSFGWPKEEELRKIFPAS